MKKDESLNNYKTTRWLPHDEFRIISQMLNILGDGIQYFYYKRYFDSKKNIFKKNNDNKTWYVYTLNSYNDLVVRNWCMIFGSHSEPTHYYNLLNYPNINSKIASMISKKTTNKNDLKSHILQMSKLTANEFDSQHKIIKNYRDKYLSHREHRPQKIKNGDLKYPELDFCKKSLVSLFYFLTEIVNMYPEERANKTCQLLVYYKIPSADIIEKLIEYPNII